MPTLVVESAEDFAAGEPELVVRGCAAELPADFCRAIERDGHGAATTPRSGLVATSLDASAVGRRSLGADSMASVGQGATLPPGFKGVDAGGNGGLGGVECPRIVQVAIDADVEFFQALGGSVAAAVAEIESIMAGVHGLYESQLGVSIVIAAIVIRTAEPDPYTSKNPATLLGQVATEWSTNQAQVDRDLVHLFTGRNLTGAPLGAAYVPGACTDLAYGLSQPLWSSVYENRVTVAAHEIGHGLSATHCNNQPQCGVMCAAVGGCTLGTLEFGSFSSQQILAFVGAATCLEPEGPPLDSIVAQGDCTAIHVSWAPLPGASVYTVWRAEAPGGIDSAELLGVSEVSEFLDDAPPPGALPLYWIGALFGDECGSELSGPVEPDASTSIPPPMEVVASAGDCVKLTVSWSLVDGALGYEIWRGLSEAESESEFLALADAGPFKDSSAAPFTTYFYWVRSINECGSAGPFGDGAPGWRNFPPQSAASPQASDGEFCDAILLLWAPVTGATHYAIWRSPTPNPAQAVQLLEVPGGFWLDQSVNTGMSYWYWVQAKSACGASGFGAGDSGVAAACADGAAGGDS